MSRSRKPRAAIAFVAATALFWSLGGPARAAITNGNISGRVLDKQTQKPLPGVTVSVTGPSLPGEQTEFTDARGTYLITELPPGEYTVRFYYANLKAERTGVVVGADKTLSVNAELSAAAADKPTFVVAQKAPNVDVAHNTIAATISEDLARSLPILGRNFDSVVTLAPGTSTDARGLQIGGGTSPENNYLVDGLNTTNPSHGVLGTPLNLEFIKETQVLVGGYNAEYGRSTGGVVHVLTKSGSNEFHGDAWFRYNPFQLDPNRVGQPGEAISVLAKGGSADRFDHAFDFGFDLGGPIIKDRIWFYVGFAPSFITQSYDRILQSRVSNLAGAPGGSPINPNTNSYPGDPDPNYQCPSYIKDQNPLLCGSGFQTKDLDSKYTQHFESQARQYSWIAKLDFRISDNHKLTLSYTGNPSTFSGVGNDPHDALSPQSDFNRNPDALPYTSSIQIHDVLAHLVSKWLDRRLQTDVLIGYHREERTLTPSDAGQSQSQVLYADPMNLASFENIPDCATKQIAIPNSTQTATFNPCPVTGYRDGGWGIVNQTSSQRFVTGLAATYFARLAGIHAIKLGADYEYNTYTNSRLYTGGADGGIYEVEGGVAGRAQFATVDANGMPVLVPGGFSATSTTHDESVYLRDSWNVGFLPGLTINVGLRWEFQQLQDPSGNTRINLWDNIAPRVGLVYDFMRNGRSRLHFSYGRYYESLPLDMSDRQFSGEGQAQQVANTCQYDASGKLLTATCAYPHLSPNDLNGGSTVSVSPTLKGQYSDEIAGGLSYDVGWDTVLGASYMYRSLGRIIEDMSTDGGTNYIIGNPGEPVNNAALQSLEAQAASLDKQASAATGSAVGDLQNQRDAILKTIAQYKALASLPAPTREYHALMLTAQKRFSHHFTLLASYTYSRSYGNYPGLYNASSGQLDPNSAGLYDLRVLLVNSSGPLPNDRPHNFKLAGAYNVPVGDGSFTFGVIFKAISGRPIQVLGAYPGYGDGINILPPGSGGRTPTITQFDLHIAYARQFGKGPRVELSWDIFNLFNQQGVTEVDDQFTYDWVAPIAGGKPEDLKGFRNLFNQPVTRNPGYGSPTAYQPPLSMRFGARLSF